MAAVAFILCVLTVQPASALLLNTCKLFNNGTWFPAKARVDVWITNVNSADPLLATNLSQADFGTAVTRALYIWNESGGTNIKLRYRGVTSLLAIDGAVVISGDRTSPLTNPPTCAAGPAFTYPEFFAQFPSSWRRGFLVVNKFYHPPSNPSSCTQAVWQVVESSPFCPGCIDLVGALVHEFGHVIYNMDHPTLPAGTDCEDIGQQSVMKGGARRLSNWDMEIAQRRYGVRSSSGQILKTRMATGTSWRTPSRATNTTSATPLFRMGSLSQVSSIRVLSWVQGGTSPSNGGAGSTYGTAQYIGGFQGQQGWASGDLLGRPPAIASKPDSSVVPETMVVYERSIGGSYYTNENGTICYRRSTNHGFTFSTETCLTAEYTRQYGLTVTYDGWSDSFLIGYLRNDNRVMIITVPATGSSTLPFTTLLAASSYYAPSIACVGLPGGCIIAYSGIDANSVLTWTWGGVGASGQFAVSTTYTQGIVLMDTPSIVWVGTDSTFRLAQTSANNAIYSYKLPPGTNTWVGTGDIYNSPLSQISTGVLGTRNFSPDPFRPEAWFLKFW
ncbi:MAG: hypothetical protein IPQ07_44350 [Myxococcales bacterium]|nr:hypothetical protein [Myxococcales bacterium]